MIDHAHGQEQRGLGKGVGKEQHEAREGGTGVPHTKHHYEEAKLAHGSVRHNQFDVELLERADAAIEHRDRAEDHERFAQHTCHVRKSGHDAGDQVHACFRHHRRGVQVGTHGGGRCHCAGKPEMEREYCGL